MPLQQNDKVHEEKHIDCQVRFKICLVAPATRCVGLLCLSRLCSSITFDQTGTLFQVSDWWEEYIYLRSRNPIMVNSNYYAMVREIILRF